MMLSKTIIGILLLVAVAGAQNPQQAAKAGTTVPQAGVPRIAAKPAVPRANPAVPVAKPATPAPARSAAKPKSTPSRPLAVKHAMPNAGKQEAPEVVATAKGKSITGTGHRDPFASIIQNRGIGNPNCSSGKKCLIVDQIVLKGVVKSPSGMLAVVENAQRNAYFLREKDPVFNGQVVRITADTIVFRERVLDKLGREMSREVIKRVAGSKPAA